MTDAQLQQALGRAKNAVQEYLIRKLLVPKIYLDAQWGGGRVDVLAVDRAGVGDVHAVEIKSYLSQPFHGYAEIPDEQTIKTLDGIRAHYKYIALATYSPDFRSDSWNFRRSDPSVDVGIRLLASDRVGRIGLLIVDLTDSNVLVDEKLRPERFRSSKEVIDLADRFVAGHTANWEVRDEPTAAP
jgi:hypothetical protein